MKNLGIELKKIRVTNKVSTHALRINQLSNLARKIESGQTNYTVKSLLNYCAFIGADVSIGNTLPLTIKVK